MSIPGDIWVFAWIEANPFSTEWTDEDSDIFQICIWTLVCRVTSVLKAKYLNNGPTTQSVLRLQVLATITIKIARH
jgi:hypothetical protein